MPTVSMANYEGEDLLSARLLSFMASGEQSSVNSEGSYISGSTNEVLNSVSLCSVISESGNMGYNTSSPIHRNVTTSIHDRTVNGSSINESGTYNGVPIGPISGSCTPPPTVSAVDLPNNFLGLRHSQVGAPPYSALTSPCLGNKLASIPQHSLLNLNGGAGDRHSLQNSPYYNHYPVNGNLQTQLQRQFPGISPGPAGALFSNNVNGFNTGSQNLVTRNGLYQDAAFSLPGFRPTNSASGCCPQRELFPAVPTTHPSNSCHNFMGPGLLMQDRLHYYAIAQKHGFIVGSELERIKENSRRSTSQSYGRISAYFRNRYGETEAKTKAAYLQLGVRVPSKDHVSEIVGKGGQKIKLIREETGALITTPGEQEEHVFIIEAPPEIAMRVAHHLATRAQEITHSKIAASERRRGSTSSQSCNNENITNGNSNSTVTTTSNNNNNNNNTGSSTITITNTTTTNNNNNNNNNSNNNSISSVASNLTSNGTNNFSIPNTCSSSNCTSGLLSLGNSANNSPLHPSTVGNNSFNGTSVLSTTTTITTNNNNNNGSNIRNPTTNLFNSNYVNLPTSPGNSNTTISTNNGLFANTNTAGSRILLARGRISVPQEMVGKIIGTQGSIITTIQKDTGTEIKSPPKEATRGPNATSEFEISAYQGLGLISNQAAECRVQQAKQLIGHLVMRQLERRASEEVEEASGSTNLSPEDQRTTTTTTTTSNNNNNNGMNNSNGNNTTDGGSNSSNGSRITSSWMWPDVAQMDSHEAREVLDRILAESKNKTRRAKELAIASSSTTSSTTISTCSISVLHNTPNSLLNLNNSNNTAQNLITDQQHFQSHYSNGNYFDTNQLINGCEDLNLLDNNSNNNNSIGDSRLLSTTITAGSSSSFSSHNTVHNMNNNSNSNNGLYNNNNSRTDDLTNGFHQVCSPRVLQNFDLLSNNDVIANLNRAPGTGLTTDLWSSQPNFNSIQNEKLINSQFTGYMNSNINLNNLINSSIHNSPTNHHSHQNQNRDHSSSSSSSLLLTHPQLNSNLLNKNQIRSDLDDTIENAFFNFNDCNSKYDLDGDLSPSSLLMQHRLHQQQQQSDYSYNPNLSHQHSQQHQPLARRHSDWVVNSSNNVSNEYNFDLHNLCTINHTNTTNTITSSSSLSSSILATDHLIGETTNESLLNVRTNSMSPNSYNFIQALDHLCLNSSTTNHSQHSNQSNSKDLLLLSNGIMVSCAPPGFESQELGPIDSFVNSSNLWSLNTNNTNDLLMTTNQTNTIVTNTIPTTAINNNNNNEDNINSFLSSNDNLLGSNQYSNSSLFLRLYNNNHVDTSMNNTTTIRNKVTMNNNPITITNSSNIIRNNSHNNNLHHHQLSHSHHDHDDIEDTLMNTNRLNKSSIWSQADLLIPENIPSNHLNSNIHLNENVKHCDDIVHDHDEYDDSTFRFSYLDTNLNDITLSQQHQQQQYLLDTHNNSFFTDQLTDFDTVTINNHNNGNSNTTTNNNNNNSELSISNTINARCGAIGEGRRRRRQSPSILSNDTDSLNAINVSSAIAPITEVA